MLHEMKVRHLHDFSIARSPKDEMLFFMVLCMTFGRKPKTEENGKVIELAKNFGKLRSFMIPDLEEQLGNYRMEDKKLAQDEVMALGLIIWYCEKKIAKHRTKVFDLNMLATTSKEIIKVANEKELAVKTFTITERHI
jgi:dihydroxyacetone kinase-like predicted kinase